MKYPTEPLKLDTLAPLLTVLVEGIKELNEYPSDGILFIAYEQGEIDKDFMQDINYYRDLVRVLAKLVGDNYDL